MRKFYSVHNFIILCIIGFGCGCESKKKSTHSVNFTQADSLTEIYLEYQDSILLAWNMMINDDNHKIKAMIGLLHEIQIAGNYDPELIKSLEHRTEQLKRIRYTSKTMSNADLVEEYDFASNSLVTELISLAEAHPAYSSNPILQKLVEQIRTADQRIENYRQAYDEIVRGFNKFLSENKDHLNTADIAGDIEKKPLFQMASE